jgi:hypothetical protein
MKKIIILAAVLLAGCSSVKLGSFAYCAHSQACDFSSLGAPAVPASAAK